MKTPSHDLITRLNRIEGQISAIKRSLENGTADDCEKVLYQLKAATNGLKRFGEAFSHEYAKRCVDEKMGHKQFAKEIDRIISTAFTLS